MSQSMTASQTIGCVPRELLKKALRDANLIRFPADKHVTDLRALLDAPSKSCGACNGCSNGCRLDAESPPAIQPHGDGVNWKAVADEQKGIIEQQQRLIASLRTELANSCRVAGRPMARPIGHVEVGADCTVALIFTDWLRSLKARGMQQIVPLYAEQAAPEAVALPDGVGRG